MLSKADILAASDMETVEVEVPEWDGTVLVSTMRGFERDEFERDLQEQYGKGAQADYSKFRVTLVRLTLVDKNGDKLFSKMDLEQLNSKNAAVLDRLFEEAKTLNKIGDKELEDATKK